MDKKVGIPVSWQTGATRSTAMSILSAMADMESPALEPSASASIAV